MTARFIVMEGTEGVGKTSQCELLVKHLRDRGYKVLQSKEPGTPALPITMALRNLMLDARYNDELTIIARELISQTIRSIHMEKLIIPALDGVGEYDFIIQDRGIVSGLAYGAACGNNPAWLKDMALKVSKAKNLYNIYSDVVFLRGNVSDGLNRAVACKQEFEAGDAMEAKGDSFMRSVEYNMMSLSLDFPMRFIDIDGLSIQDVHEQILKVLGL